MSVSLTIWIEYLSSHPEMHNNVGVNQQQQVLLQLNANICITNILENCFMLFPISSELVIFRRRGRAQWKFYAKNEEVLSREHFSNK